MIAWREVWSCVGCKIGQEIQKKKWKVCDDKKKKKLRMNSLCIVLQVNMFSLHIIAEKNQRIYINVQWYCRKGSLCGALFCCLQCTCSINPHSELISIIMICFCYQVKIKKQTSLRCIRYITTGLKAWQELGEKLKNKSLFCWNECIMNTELSSFVLSFQLLLFLSWIRTKSSLSYWWVPSLKDEQKDFKEIGQPK